MPRSSRSFVLSVAGVCAASALGFALLGGARAQDRPASQPAQPPAAQGKRLGGGDPSANLVGSLVEGLQATPGCMGVEVARTMSGKNAIFAWFEGKKAAMAWYDSPTHRAAMERFFPGFRPDHKPMERIADDCGPIMVVAALVPARDAASAVSPEAPVSQISIELYAPMSGGVRLNGGFAPSSLKVDGMRDLSAVKPAATAEPK